MRKLLFVLLALLPGCATQQHFREVMDTWIGKPEERVIARLGPPQSSYVLQNGGKVLQYVRSTNMPIQGVATTQAVTTTTTGRIGSTPVYGTSTTYQPVPAPVYNIELNCNVTFTLDANGTVTQWSAQGNHCVM